MATNEEEDEEPTRAEIVRTFFGDTVTRVTDTGPATGMSLRVWALIIALGAVIATNDDKRFRVTGLVSLLALALSLASRTRGGR